VYLANTQISAFVLKGIQQTVVSTKENITTCNGWTALRRCTDYEAPKLGTLIKVKCLDVTVVTAKDYALSAAG
jgi:hypothetical protein